MIRKTMLLLAFIWSMGPFEGLYSSPTNVTASDAVMEFLKRMHKQDQSEYGMQEPWMTLDLGQKGPIHFSRDGREKDFRWLGQHLEKNLENPSSFFLVYGLHLSNPYLAQSDQDYVTNHVLQAIQFTVLIPFQWNEKKLWALAFFEDDSRKGIPRRLRFVELFPDLSTAALFSVTHAGSLVPPWEFQSELYLDQLFSRLAPVAVSGSFIIFGSDRYHQKILDFEPSREGYLLFEFSPEDGMEVEHHIHTSFRKIIDVLRQKYDRDIQRTTKTETQNALKDFVQALEIKTSLEPFLPFIEEAQMGSTITLMRDFGYFLQIHKRNHAIFKGPLRSIEDQIGNLFMEVRKSEFLGGGLFWAGVMQSLSKIRGNWIAAKLRESDIEYEELRDWLANHFGRSSKVRETWSRFRFVGKQLQEPIVDVRIQIEELLRDVLSSQSILASSKNTINLHQRDLSYRVREYYYRQRIPAFYQVVFEDVTDYLHENPQAKLEEMYADLEKSLLEELHEADEERSKEIKNFLRFSKPDENFFRTMQEYVFLRWLLLSHQTLFDYEMMHHTFSWLELSAGTEMWMHPEISQNARGRQNIHPQGWTAIDRLPAILGREPGAMDFLKGARQLPQLRAIRPR